MVGQSYSLLRVEGRSSLDGIVSRQVVDHMECYVLSDLLGVVANGYGQCNCAKGEYPCSSETSKQSVCRNQLLSINPHLLERLVVNDVS